MELQNVTLEIETLLERLSKENKMCLGYPLARDFDYGPIITKFMQYHVNNIGDPFEEGTSSLHTKEVERQVIAFFANLFKAPENNWWGYVTNGGSEGNLYGLYLAREMYPNGIVYYSEATHYSVRKNVHLLGMNSVVVKTQPNGEIDYKDLKEVLNHHRTQPAIILANLGTTMTEAKDDIKKIKVILKKVPIISNYIHVDGALTGSYACFLKEKPHFDFEDGADSIAISGHKFLGCPIPCGVVIVKKHYRNRIANSIEYVGGFDTTITGSRNAQTPVLLAYRLNELGKNGLEKRIKKCLEIAHYCQEKLRQKGYHPWRNEQAITVVFDRISEKLCKKWHLASEENYSHIICMPGVTKEKIDELTADLQQK